MKRSDFIKMIGVGGGSFMLKGGTSDPLMYQLKEICIYDNYVRGTNHYMEAINKIQITPQMPIELYRKKDNPYDSFAVAIHVCEKKSAIFQLLKILPLQIC